MLNISSKDRQKCISANEEYVIGNLEKTMEILNIDDIMGLPCALHNKAFICYNEDYTDDEELDSIEYAKKLLNDSLDISNSNLKTHLLLGKIYFEEQNYDLSAKEFNNAVNLHPNVISLNNLGVVLHYLNRNKESEICFKKALEIENNPITAYNLALEYALSHSDECERLISQINLGDDVDNIDIGRIYYMIGKYEMTYKNFDLMWDNIVPNVLDYSMYLYSLKKMNLTDKYNSVCDEAKNLIKECINDFDCDDAINTYTNLLDNLNTIDEQLKQNCKPTVILNPKMLDDCYLYYYVTNNDNLN